VDQAGHRTVVLLPEGVPCLSGRKEILGPGGDDRSAKGLGLILSVQEARIIGSDGQRELPLAAGDGPPLAL